MTGRRNINPPVWFNVRPDDKASVGDLITWTQIDRPVYLDTDCTESAPAWLVHWRGLPEVVVVVHAPRASRAKARALAEVREGYPEAAYIEMRARRAPQEDGR